MSDLVNALNQQSRSSGVLDAIAHPNVVNPLAAMAGAAQTANTIYQVRQNQANQAAGEAYQNAIDPQTGEFDANKFRQNLQAAGPAAAMAAGSSLANTQQISSDQLNQARVKTAWVNGAAGSLTRLGPNITQADVISTLHQGVTSGMLSEAEFERQVAEVGALGNDPAKLNAWANQHQFNAMSVQQQLDQSFGTRETVVTPGATYSTVVPPARQGGTVTTQHGPAPGQTTEAVVPMDDQGVIPQDANGNPVRTPKTWQKVTVPVTAVPGVPKGGPPQLSTAPPPPPKGTNVIPNGGYVAPGSPSPAPAPAPAPAAPAASGGSAGGKGPPPSQRSDIPSGVQVASADGSFAPSTVPPAAAPSDAVAGDVAAIQGGQAQAQATPSGGTQVAQNGPILRAAPPPGYDERLKQDQTQYAGDQANLNNRYTNVQNLNTAMEALKLTNTGRSTGAVHNFYSFLQSQGIAPGFVDNDVTQYDIARKAMMAFAASRAGGAAGTDMARLQSELSNASPEIAQGAAMHVLKQALGNERMEIAANLDQQDTSGAGYGQNKAKFYQQYDPRGFAWDTYDAAEQKKIMDDASQVKGGLDKLRASIRKAVELKLMSRPSTSEAEPSPSSGPVATPPVSGATANPLAMATSPNNSSTANALAA